MRGNIPGDEAIVKSKGAVAGEDERAIAESNKEQRRRVKRAWHPVAAPQGVSHYNVYRWDSEAFEAEPATLLGSPSDPVFYDVGLEAGRTVYYRIRAVDAWGNQSPASTAAAVVAK